MHNIRRSICICYKLPAQYSLFMVTNMLQDGFNFSVVSSNKSLTVFVAIARCMDDICWATTESTSNSIRSNSSRITQAPDWISPYKQTKRTRVQFQGLSRRITERRTLIQWAANAKNIYIYTIQYKQNRTKQSNRIPYFKELAQNCVIQAIRTIKYDKLFARAFAKSLHVSVFPAPLGPSIDELK